MLKFIDDQLKHNPFFLTAFLGGSVSVLILFFKSFGREITAYIRRQIVFSCVVYQTDPLYLDFETWFYSNYGEKYKNVEASIRETIDNYVPVDNHVTGHKIYFRQSEGIFLIKHHGKFILIKKGKEKVEHASDIRSLFFNQYHFFSIRGSKAVKAMLEECVAYSSKKAKANELKIYSNNSYGEWIISGRISAKDINNVIIPADKRSEIINDMDTFMAAKEDYDKRHIFYKRGYGFIGDPGNGKTSLTLSMASYMGKNIYNLDLNTLTENGYLKNLFVNLNNDSVLVVEDIDSFFNLRKTVRLDSKISFSTFLNCVDGVNYKEGLVLIITTNCKETLDPALIRAGRIDYLLEIPRPGVSEINMYLQVFYGQMVDCPADYAGTLSMCDIQEICLNNKTDINACVNEITRRSTLKKIA